MKIFTFEEKLNLTKWYFNGKSTRDIFDLYCSKFGRKRGVEPSLTGIVYPCEKFEKNGCIHGSCTKCNGTEGRAWKRVMSDERELNEIMVCAAAELELSMRDISIELEIPQRTVANILRRNGYSIMSLIEESKDETQIEKVSPEKRQIVKWYCQGKTLSDITKLYNENFKQIYQVKDEILKTILQYEKYGCLRDCEKCSKKTDKSRLNLKIKDVEGLIIKQIKELEEKDTKKKDALPLESDNKKIKLECCVETTVLASKSDSVKDSKYSNFVKENVTESSLKENSIERESEEKIEFVSVEPSLKIIVAEKTNKRKKKKLSS